MKSNSPQNNHKPQSPSHPSHNSSPLVHNSAFPSLSDKLAGIMDKYVALLKDRMAECRAQSDLKPQTLRQIRRMFQNVLTYERNQIRLEQRQRSLEIREAELKLKLKRAARAEMPETVTPAPQSQRVPKPCVPPRGLGRAAQSLNNRNRLDLL